MEDKLIVILLFVTSVTNVLSDTCPVFLTLSSLSKHIEDASVVINWGPECETPPAWIGFYRENPALSNTPPLVKILVEGQKSGEIVTEQKFGKLQLPGGWSHDEVLRVLPKRRSNPLCFDFYVVSYDGDDELQTFECLKIQPNWMFSEQNIGSVPLKDLFLPGTHCSACYQTKANVNNVFLKRVGFRQDLDIWSQLIFGIRYLDFSVGFFPSHNGTRNFWVMNESYRVGGIGPILDDIRRFVVLTEETVILDFRRFPLGFHNHPEQHGEFLQVLDQRLGDLVFRRAHFGDDGVEETNSYHLTIEQMRREGKYILVTYNHAASLNDSDLIWAPWKKHSSSFLKHTELGEFMRNLFSQKHPDAPKNIGWSFHGVQGLQSSLTSDETYLMPKERANIINPKLMQMLGGPWSLRANAVLLDYFHNTNLIDMAVYTNRYKTLKNVGEEMVVLDIQ
ncbi:uncharacterized protein LOC129770994 [Toxorhynchites rutilus septentrionalis]|uniref:uncharacterized protein LOC129770994 n=1 Tax=Toxorhynchites rutilus septentrionalis TaxID=329112 RepID=UPI00247AF423|nr:uncharacterized protein LOC129770994 [Toxorhynchites rutilus septentrionalis]